MQQSSSNKLEESISPNTIHFSLAPIEDTNNKEEKIEMSKTTNMDVKITNMNNKAFKKLI